jgi:uncharacterized membrane protein YkvI
MVQSILDNFIDQRSLLAPMLYVGIGGALVAAYRARRDLLILTMAAFSLIVVVTTGAGQLFDDGFGSYIVLSALVIVQAAAVVHVLRRMQRAWEQTI